MSIEQIEKIYNIIYILILIIVCGAFSYLQARWNKKKLNYWLGTTVLFVLISFVTISLWYITVGFII